MTEAEKRLLNLVAEKDFAGLELLIDLFGTTIIKTIQYVLNQPAEQSIIKDVQNKVFYQLWQELPRFDQEQSQLKTWITVITRNLAVDQKRRLIRQQAMIPVAQVPETTTAANDDYFPAENFLELLVSLSVEDQLIFMKFYYYQETAVEIARDLTMTPELIYNRLSRGRRKLASVLKPERSDFNV